jgi:hypothetical protein
MKFQRQNDAITTLAEIVGPALKPVIGLPAIDKEMNAVAQNRDSPNANFSGQKARPFGQRREGFLRG